MAVQVPASGDSPLYDAVKRVAKSDSWYRYTIGCESLHNYRSAEYYYPILATLKGEFDIWQTTYFHRLSSYQGLIEWYRGTGMKPFLDKLPNSAARKNFETEVLEQSAPHYSVQVDGTVLFPFKRIFFTIYK
jgi:trans-aconitate 2-methyltransferase